VVTGKVKADERDNLATNADVGFPSATVCVIPPGGGNAFAFVERFC
jgi:hypothetical protein